MSFGNPMTSGQGRQRPVALNVTAVAHAKASKAAAAVLTVPLVCIE